MAHTMSLDVVGPVQNLSLQRPPHTPAQCLAFHTVKGHT